MRRFLHDDHCVKLCGSALWRAHRSPGKLGDHVRYSQLRVGDQLSCSCAAEAVGEKDDETPGISFMIIIDVT